MAKPKQTLRPTYLNLSLPEDLRAMLDLLLYSPLESRIPHGAYSNYIGGLIRRDLEERQKAVQALTSETQDA